MENEFLSFNKKNQYCKSIVTIGQCENHKITDETVDADSYPLDCRTYSISFSPCEIEKKLNVSTTVGCNCCNKPIPKNDCLSTPCTCVHEVFIDASKCKEYSHCHSDDHSSYYSDDHSEDYSEYYSEDHYADHLCHSELDYQDISKEERFSDDNANTVVQNLIHETEDFHEKKPDSSLTIAALTSLLDMLLKNSSNKTSSKNEPNEKEHSKKHKDSKHHKRHKHDKYRKKKPMF